MDPSLLATTFFGLSRQRKILPSREVLPLQKSAGIYAGKQIMIILPVRF
jgi:hypothetical protein